MLNAVPQIRLSGENGELFTQLMQALVYTTETIPHNFRRFGQSWYARPNAADIKQDICNWMSHLLPPLGHEAYVGFKIIKRNAWAQALQLFPNAHIVVNYARNVSHQSQSAFWAKQSRNASETAIHELTSELLTLAGRSGHRQGPSVELRGHGAREECPHMGGVELPMPHGASAERVRVCRNG